MKAKEYYAKYGEQLKDKEARVEAMHSMTDDLVDEFFDLVKKRGVKTDRGVMACVNEINNKWNAIAAHFNPPVIRRNAFQERMFAVLGMTKEEADKIRRGRK